MYLSGHDKAEGGGSRYSIDGLGAGRMGGRWGGNQPAFCTWKLALFFLGRRLHLHPWMHWSEKLEHTTFTCIMQPQSGYAMPLAGENWAHAVA